MKKMIFSVLALVAFSSIGVAQKVHGQIANIVISAPTLTLTLGQSVQATAVAYDAQGHVVTSGFNWQQYNKGSVSVNNTTGVVTAIRVGADGAVRAHSGHVESNVLTFTVIAATSTTGKSAHHVANHSRAKH